MSTHSYLQAVVSLILGKSVICLGVNILFVRKLAGLLCNSEVFKVHLKSLQGSEYGLPTCPHGIVAPSANLSLSKLASMAITAIVRGQLRIGSSDSCLDGRSDSVHVYN